MLISSSRLNKMFDQKYVFVQLILHCYVYNIYKLDPEVINRVTTTLANWGHLLHLIKYIYGEYWQIPDKQTVTLQYHTKHILYIN